VQEIGMNFDDLFQQRLETLHREGRYRVFADLKRRRGFFPVANHLAADGSLTPSPAHSDKQMGRLIHALNEVYDAFN
jgi:5-aminolevulinate synthase